MTIRNPLLPREPFGTLVLMVLLFFSGSITYTLAVAYFYNPKNKFLASTTRLLPRIEFRPDGEQEEIGPNKTDWFYTSIFLLVGTLDVVIMVVADYHGNVFFNFCGIHDFTSVTNISTTEYEFYKYINVPLLFWALEGGVVMCCVFFVLTRDIVRHIDFTQRLIIENYHDISTAKRRFLCLLNYTKEVAASLQLWFVVHSTVFFFLILFDMIDLLSGTTKIRHCHWYWVAQVSGSFLIAFKFAFPFFAASRVSRRFDNMLKEFNEHFDVEQHRNSESFLTFCKREKAGYTISGIRITFNLAMFSFLFSFLGILKEYIYVAVHEEGKKASLAESMIYVKNLTDA